MLCRAFILYSGSLPRRTLCRLRLSENYSDCARCTSHCAGTCTPHVKSRHYLADKKKFDFILRIFFGKFQKIFQDLLNIPRAIVSRVRDLLSLPVTPKLSLLLSVSWSFLARIVIFDEQLKVRGDRLIGADCSFIESQLNCDSPDRVKFRSIRRAD